MTTWSKERYEELCESSAGYCRKCRQVTRDFGIEPDAEKYECPDCGGKHVYGIEQSVLLGFVGIEGDE